MTSRQGLVNKLVVYAGYRSSPKDFAAFKMRCLEWMDEFPPALQAELDRIEEKPQGLTRLINEAWRHYNRTK